MKIASTITYFVGLISFLTLSEITESAPTFTEMVPMRDGVRLATDVYLPQGEGPWPAIFITTPYGKGSVSPWALGANQRGYAFIAQDFRGRFDSEGEDYPVFLSCGWVKHQDGYDSIEWIASQKWCNGKVGTIGMSAPGIAQNMMAPNDPPHLVCQYVVVAFSNGYYQCAYQGGAFRKDLWERWLKECNFSPETLRLTRENPDYNEFWELYNTEKVANQVNAPTMYVGGWYDIFNAGTINSFMTVQKGGGERARGKCRLVMEAYGHGRNEELAFPDINRPKTADISFCFDWFDIWMKNDGKGLENIPVVQYFVMGDPEDKAFANIWKTADNWPIPAQITPFYFIPNGSLKTEPHNESGSFKSYKYDPNNPVPTLGGMNLFDPKGPTDHRKIENRSDVLVFTSETLDKPMEVTGAVKVKLWASSTALDTDFTAMLCDVYPDGRSILVTDGIIRACHRSSMEKRELMEPGKIYEFEIDLWNTSIVFSKGHKIRVLISSSNSPRFEPNPNTGKPSGMDDETRVAENTIYLNSEYPSHILLPIVTW